MYQLKKQYENESIVYKGRLLTKRNLTDSIIQDIISSSPSLSNRFELVEEPKEDINDVIQKEPKEDVVKKTRSKKSK